MKKYIIALLMVGLLQPYNLTFAQTSLPWSYYPIGSPTALSFALTDTDLTVTATLSDSTQGFTIGSQYYQYARNPFRTSPWQVDYSVTSFAGTGNCTIRPVIQNGNALTGANTITLSSTLSATTSNLTFTSPSTNNGQFGVGIVRSSGTCQLTIKFTAIRDSSGNLLWSPATDATSEINFPDDIQFTSDTIIWSMGFMIFLMALNTWYVIIRRK